MERVLVDVDDLWHEGQITRFLVPIKEQVPDFRVTCYAIPNKLGDVSKLAEKYPWITFAQHGWEHTPFECRAWTEDIAIMCLERAKQLGYAPIVKPPNWIFDVEVENACRFREVTLHHHQRHTVSNPVGLSMYPGPKGTQDKNHSYVHSHIQPNPVTDSILTNPMFKPEKLLKITSFLTIPEVSVRF